MSQAVTQDGVLATLDTQKNVPNGIPGLDADGNLVGTITIMRDTAANLAAVVPAAGELAIASDTGKLVSGDGTTTFADLADLLSTPKYFRARTSQFSSIGSAGLQQPDLGAAERDDLGAWNATTNVYTVPHDGYYHLSGGIVVESTSHPRIVLMILRDLTDEFGDWNWDPDRFLAMQELPQGTLIGASFYISCSAIVHLTAGQEVSLWVDISQQDVSAQLAGKGWLEVTQLRRL